MRAISLWQPWASAVAIGSKRVETRHWTTSYRGPLAIHAAKRLNWGEMHHLHSCWGWIGAMREAGWSWGNNPSMREQIEAMPFGAIVAVCNLSDCRPTDSFTQAELDERRRHDGDIEAYGWSERMMGNYDLGRYGWMLDDIRPLPTPVPFRGRQGFFNVPDELLP